MKAPATVRARVTALATVTVLAVLGLGGVALVAQQRHVLTESLDESLVLRARELVALGRDVPDEITGLGEDDMTAQVIEDGTVVAASANVAGEPPVAAVTSTDGVALRTVDGLPHEDGRFRLASTAVEDEGVSRVILVAGTLDDIDDSIATLVRSLLLAVPVVVIALAFALWWLVGRTLRPVEAIRSQVAAIGGSDLDRRVPVPPGDDEIARLARTMNGMLDRVAESARRQQRFLADASHELRSPLTRVRTELEVDLAHPEGADPLATHRSVLAETVGLQRLTDDLLLLARGDAGAALPLRSELVDLDDLVLRVARRLQADERVAVDLAGVSAAQVHGDPDHLLRLVGNLADNAVRHAHHTVRLALVEEGGWAVLTVADDGPGVPPEDRERIFERFARVDGARRAADGGAGLGLAIARDIATRHGGILELADDPLGRGTRFVLRLPLPA